MNDETQHLWQFMWQQSGKLLEQTLAHIGLTFASLLLAIMIGVPLGILVARKKLYRNWILNTAGVLQTIPSIALLGFMIPLLGIGPKPAIAALMLYALLPIIRNTYAGIAQVDASVTDAAKGMGMTNAQILRKVELPLAMPVILAGIRTATVINVGVATLAAYIAAGGLGEFIFGGIALNNTNMILAGAIPAALLAILLDFLLAQLQQMKAKRFRQLSILLPASLVLFASFYFLPAAFGSAMVAGFTPEFMGRKDGFIGLKKTYGMNIRTVVISDAVMYKAAFEKKLDVISGYSTDGRLKAFDLVVLEDDRKIFPPYHAAPIVRHDVLARYPELETTLNLLAGTISDSLMTLLNYKVDYLKQSPEKVARDFLMEKGMYKPSRMGKKGSIKMGSKIFGEQYILLEMYRMVIEGYTDLKAEMKTGLGGTKICFDALVNGQIDLYPEYTGTGLLVLLRPSPADVKALGGNSDQVYQYVQKAFNRQYQVKWLKPLGFNNTYALMMRREQAESLQIQTISDLQLYLQNK